MSPEAQLLAWDATTAWVRCPYCQEEEIASEKAKCGAGDYTYLVPQPGEEHPFVIDKATGRYLAKEEPRSSGSEVLIVESFQPLAKYRDNTVRVLEFASSIRHRVSKDQASHTIKNLAAEFLDRHIWLPTETKVDPQLKKEVDHGKMRHWWFRSNSDAIRHYERQPDLEIHPDVLKSESQRAALDAKQKELKRQQDLASLAAIAPKGTRTASIRTPYKACDDCQRFVAGVNEEYKVKIELVHS